VQQREFYPSEQTTYGNREASRQNVTVNYALVLEESRVQGNVLLELFPKQDSTIKQLKFHTIQDVPE
jgi:hypothetical protein